MSQFTFFADVLTALGGAIEKDKKKTKPETQIPLRPEVSQASVPAETVVPEVQIPLRPPEPEVGRPARSDYVDTGIPYFETRLDDPNDPRGIIQPDGRIGTHQMRAEIDPETGKMTAFPMIVDMPGLNRLHQFKDPGVALNYNKSLNNVRVFDDPQEGIDYAAGGYKKGTPLDDTPVGQFNQQFGSVPELSGLMPKKDEPFSVVPAQPEVPTSQSVVPTSQPEAPSSTTEVPDLADQYLKEALQYQNKSGKVEPNTLRYLYEKSGKNPSVLKAYKDKYNYEYVPKTSAGGFQPLVDKIGGYFERNKQEREEQYRQYQEDQLSEQAENLGFEVVKKVPEVSDPPKGQDTTTQDSTSQDTTTQQQVDSSNQVVADPNNQGAKSSIDTIVDDVVSQEDFPRLMPGEGSNQQTLEETFNQEVLDNQGNVVKDPKQSFLSKLWDGVKDVIVTQIQDPVNQKALFAYAVSRALGYDGVTLASQVLSNEWKQQAATKKHERELERIYGKERVAAFKKQKENQTIDYSKPVVLYNADTNQNVTVYLSKDNQSFTFGTGDTQPYSIQSLLSKGYTIGEGLDFEGQREVLTDFMLTDAETITGDIIDELNANEDIKPGVRQDLIKQLNNAKSPYVIREAMVAFTNKYGKTADYDSSDVQAMASRGIQNYLRAVSEGRAKGSKDLIGYMDYEALKYDISKTNIPEAFFTIAEDSKVELGVNGWSRTNNVVNKIANNINSRLGKGSYTDADIYSVLSDEFFKKFGDGTSKFATYWNKRSKNSADDKAEASSPAMLWIQGIISGQDESPDYKSPSLKEVVDMLAARKKS